MFRMDFGLLVERPAVSPVRREGQVRIDNKPKTTNGFHVRQRRDAGRDATRPVGVLRQTQSPTCLSVPPLGQITSTSPSILHPPPPTPPPLASLPHQLNRSANCLRERERERERSKMAGDI